MEYRCYVVGDAVTEPGALLRRLLRQPFPPTEERTLQHHSLLFTRSEEAKGTNAYTMAVSLPQLQEARTASLTLPNPSMPSVDVTVQFAAVADTREFERVMLGHYAGAGGGRGGTIGFGRSLRRSFSSPMSSLQDLVSSDVSSLPSGAHGIALHAPPQAIVLAFNPFSMCSFSKLRVEWVHSLLVLRQQRQQRLDAAIAAQQQQQQQQQQARVQDQQQQERLQQSASQLLRPTSTVFAGASVPVTPLTATYPFEAVESFPAVLLVAVRMELMRDTMEATPSVHVPSSLEVTEVAQALQAQAYVEVSTNCDESIDLLRTTVARACMGELANAPVVTYNMVYAARQASVARAIEAVQVDPYEEEEEEEGDQEEGAGGGGGGMHHHHGGGEAADADDANAARRSPPHMTLPSVELHTSHAQLNTDDASTHTTQNPSEHEHSRLSHVMEREDSDVTHNTAHSPDGSSVMDGGTEDGAHAAAAAETPMRGRQLRRHLVTALAPLVVPHSTPATSRDAAAAAAAQNPREEARETGALSRTPSAAATAAGTRWTWRRHPRTGRVFYVRRTTGTSQYERPEDYDGPPVAADADAAAAAAVAASAPSPAVAEEDSVSRKGESSDAKAEEAAASHGGDVTNDSHGEGTKDGADRPAAVAERRANADVGEGDDDGDDAESPQDATATTAAEGVDSWRQRQQLRLRRAQVARLEHQLRQLRLQSTRLRAQSDANAELKRTAAALRGELEDKEQAFSARVAEQNLQLASDVLSTTVAIEELTGVGQPVLPSTERKERQAGAAGGAGGDARDAAAPTGRVADISELDKSIEAAMQRLRGAVDQRDAVAAAVRTLRQRCDLVAQRTGDAAAEVAVLLRRGVELEDAAGPLQEDLDHELAEARHLRERIRLLEQQQQAQTHQREGDLEARVAQQHHVESQVRELERLQQTCVVAQQAYEAALHIFGLSRRLRPATVQEENTRVRLSLERSTGRCAEALLTAAAALHTVTVLRQDLTTAVQRLESQRSAQLQRLAQAKEAAAARRAEAVRVRYTSSASTSAGVYDREATRNGHDVRGAPLELLEVAVRASASACEQWQLHDDHVTAPLLARARAVEAELLLLLRRVSDRLPKSNWGRHRNSQRGDAGGGEEAVGLAWWWLRAAIAGVCASAEQQCDGAWRAYKSHLASMHEKALALTSPDTLSLLRTSSRSTVQESTARSTPLPAPAAVESSGLDGDVVEKSLWATCDSLMKRLPGLDGSFVRMYTEMRPSAS